MALKDAWKNAYYRYTMAYVVVIVTLIFGFQMYRYFVALPSDEVNQCPPTSKSSSLVLIPVIGVLFDDDP